MIPYLSWNNFITPIDKCTTLIKDTSLQKVETIAEKYNWTKSQPQRTQLQHSQSENLQKIGQEIQKSYMKQSLLEMTS